MKKEAIYPGGRAAFVRQLLNATLNPQAMSDFFTKPEGFQRMLDLGFTNWASLATALGGHDYKPQEMVGMQENPGYRIPGLDPAAETDLAAGGFDYLGPHSPTVPSSTPRPSGIAPEPDPDVYYEKLGSGNKKFRLANQPTPEQPAQAETSKPPLPGWTFEDLVASLKQIERSQQLSEEAKVQNYKRILDEYSSSIRPLRNWLSQNGISSQQLKGIANEAEKRRK
jgi:hypothetical protein